MALYVYYHGNNLVAFGIVKGMQATDPQNKGMKYADEIDPTLVDPALIQAVKEQEEMQRQATFEDIMRNAIKSSQRESYKMSEAGLIRSDIFENTPDAVIEEDYTESMDLSFFNELNMF